MSVSYRLIAVLAAAMLTATTFVLPAYAAPAGAAHTVITQAAAR